MKSAGKWAAVCFFTLILCHAAGFAQTPPPAPAPQPSSAPPSMRTRRLAYQRYIEAQRAKGDAQRTRSARLLEEAIRGFRETIQLDPTAPDPHVDLGQIYFFSNTRRDMAEREALEAVRLDPNHVGGHLLLGRLYLSSSRTEDSIRSTFVDSAIREYEKVAELDPKMAEAWAVLSDLYALKKNIPRQIAALEKWAASPIPGDTMFYNRVMNSDLSSEQAWYKLSTLYLSQNRNREAIEAARRAYEANPESNDYARNLIGILRIAGTSEDELRIYSQMLKTAATPALLIGYGSALVRAGRYPEAELVLKEFVQYDPSNASAIGLLAIAQRRAGRRIEAIETLRSGVTRAEAGVRTELMLELGQTFEESGRNEEAAVQYEAIFDGILSRGQLSQINAQLFGEIVQRLVRVYRRAGNPTKLQAILARTRRAIDEHNPLLDIISIQNLREEGRRREALDLAQAAVRRYPEDRSLKFTESILLADMKRYRESTELLSSMLRGEAEYATDDALVHQMLSSIHLQRGQLKEAEIEAQKAMELNPGDVEATLQLATVLDRQARHVESERLLRELLAREPDNATALNNLGYYLVERNTKLPEAIKLIERAVAIEPINGSFLDSLAWAHHKVGNQDKAREYLEKALLYSRRNPTIHEHLGDVLNQAGRLAEARRHWEKALEYSIEANEIARLKGKLKERK